MKVQLLSFPGCPNADAARAALHRALATARVKAEFEEIDTTAPHTPYHLRGWGSPTILIDGMDIVGETTPSGASCRLYREPDGHAGGTPPAALIRAALARTSRGRSTWLRSLAPVPGALLPLLPSVSCPACLAAYAGVVSALGLGFLFTERVLAPLIAGFLVVGIATIGWSSRTHGRRGPLLATLVGSAAVAAGRLIWRIPPAMYGGMALLVVASLWNMWLKRPQPSPLIQIRLGREKGASL